MASDFYIQIRLEQIQASLGHATGLGAMTSFFPFPSEVPPAIIKVLASTGGACFPPASFPELGRHEDSALWLVDTLGVCGWRDRSLLLLLLRLLLLHEGLMTLRKEGFAGALGLKVELARSPHLSLAVIGRRSRLSLPRPVIQTGTAVVLSAMFSTPRAVAPNPS